MASNRQNVLSSQIAPGNANEPCRYNYIFPARIALTIMNPMRWAMPLFGKRNENEPENGKGCMKRTFAVAALAMLSLPLFSCLKVTVLIHSICREM